MEGRGKKKGRSTPKPVTKTWTVGMEVEEEESREPIVCCWPSCFLTPSGLSCLMWFECWRLEGYIACIYLNSAESQTGKKEGKRRG